MPTHYEVLGVGKDANENEIRKAYRSLSLKYHPDRNVDPSAGDKFREINEANEILSDSQKRQQYDHELQFGTGTMEAEMGDINNIINMMFSGGGFQGMGFPGMRVHRMGGGPGVRIFHNGQQVHGHNSFDPFEEMFQQMHKPAPITKHIEITLEQAYTGGRISFDIEKSVVFNGLRSTEIETINIDIPKGIDNNECIILRDQGNVAHESNKGDLKIMFQIKNTTPFNRNGLDLHIQKTISLKDSLCGFVVEIQHLNGKKIAMNNMMNSTVIKPNYKKVVPNLGMMREGQTGNLIIEFLVEFPESISPEVVEKLKEIL